MCAVKSRRESLAVGIDLCDRRGDGKFKGRSHEQKYAKTIYVRMKQSEQPPPAMRIGVRVYAMSWASCRHAPTLRQRLDSFT